MHAPYSTYADNTLASRMTAKKLTAADGPLTRWRQAHPNADQSAWQESMDYNFEILNRLRGGPFLVDQFAVPKAYELYRRSFHAQIEGFRAVSFRTTMNYGHSHPESMDFMVFSVDTPKTIPRTAVRPARFSDHLHGGFQHVKIGDQQFDHDFHVQSEDEQFAKALISPAMMAFLHGSQLAETFAFVFDRGTLSTWNYDDVIGPGGNAYVLDYMSMMIDYLVQVFKSTPGQLWQG